MKLKAPMLALTMALGCIQPAKAEVTGMQLQEWCNGSEDTIDRARCITFMFGFISGLNFTDGKVCLPNGVTVGQAALIVRKWTREHPEELHRDPASVAGRALLTAYACKKNAH
jgi:hypothetical protein